MVSSQYKNSKKGVTLSPFAQPLVQNSIQHHRNNEDHRSTHINDTHSSFSGWLNPKKENSGNILGNFKKHNKPYHEYHNSVHFSNAYNALPFWQTSYRIPKDMYPLVNIPNIVVPFTTTVKSMNNDKRTMKHNSNAYTFIQQSHGRQNSSNTNTDNMINHYNVTCTLDSSISRSDKINNHMKAVQIGVQWNKTTYTSFVTYIDRNFKLSSKQPYIEIVKNGILSSSKTSSLTQVLRRSSSASKSSHKAPFRIFVCFYVYEHQQRNNKEWNYDSTGPFLSSSSASEPKQMMIDITKYALLFDEFQTLQKDKHKRSSSFHTLYKQGSFHYDNKCKIIRSSLVPDGVFQTLIHKAHSYRL